MHIKRKNFEICKMSLGGNDAYKNKLVKIFKAETKCLKTSKKKKKKTNANRKTHF